MTGHTMIFWAIATLLAILAVLPIATALLRPRAGRGQDSDLAVYRDQLDEVDRDLARGVLSEDEAARIRIEVQRRLLEADRHAAKELGTAPATLNGAITVGLTVAILGGALALYHWQGAPGYPDLPLKERLARAEQAREDRPSQATAASSLPPSVAPEISPEFEALLTQLRAALATRPDDLAGHRLLARNEAALGNYEAAMAAQQRVIDIMGSDVTGFEVSRLGEIMVTAAGGYVSPEAETVFQRALDLDASDGVARYYTGLGHLQVGRYDLAFSVWRPLLENSPDDAPWVAPIRAQILQVAERAGIRYALPEVAATGPSAAEMAAAEDMTPEERAAMINTMVAGLSDRLAREGGPATDWARLIAAYGVLGRRDEARAIWEEAQQVFAGRAEDLAELSAAADRAGLDE